jgi:trigger factor
MQVSVTATEGLQRRMTVAVPASLIDQQVRDRLKSLAGRVRIDGFRPGHVPMSVVERRYGAQVRAEVNSDVVERTFNDAIAQEKLRPVGQPDIEMASAEPGADLQFTATFEVFPSIDLELSEVCRINRPAVAVTDADVDVVVDRIRKQNVKWAECSRAAQDGDRVNIDFNGAIDGAPFEGGQAEAYDLVLGSRNLVGDFEQQLIGAAAGADVAVNVVFPDDYPVANLTGKAASFAVHVNTVSEPVLPELSDEFFASLGVAEGGLERFRQQVRENIEREVKEAVKARVKVQAVDYLFDKVKVDLPKGLVDNEVALRMRNARNQLANNGVDVSNLQLDSARFEPAARHAVAVGLIVAEIVRRHKLNVTADQLRAKVESLSAGYDDPQAVVNWYFSDRRRLSDVEAVLLEENAVDWLLQKAQIEDVPMSVMELLDPKARAATS